MTQGDNLNHLGIFQEPWVNFLTIYLMLCTFWAEFLLSGGNFAGALKVLGAFMVKLGLFLSLQSTVHTGNEFHLHHSEGRSLFYETPGTFWKRTLEVRL